MHCGSVAERAIQYRIRHHRERRAIAAAARKIAFTMTSGSSPPLAPITNASDVAASETANRMLLVSFKTCAAPGLLPAMVTVGPHEAISGRTLSIAAGSADTITDSVPVHAPAGPPATGQSTTMMPFGAKAASTSRKNGTPTV